MEGGSEKFTKYCCGRPAVNKPVGNAAVALHKYKGNKNRQ